MSNNKNNRFSPYKKNKTVLQQKDSIELTEDDILENINNEIPENLCDDLVKDIEKTIKLILKRNIEGNTTTEDLFKQLYHINKRKTNTEKNKYICFYGWRIFPPEDGEKRFNKKINLYKTWFLSSKPEVYKSLEKIYNIYFKYSKYYHETIADDNEVELKFKKFLSDSENNHSL